MSDGSMRARRCLYRALAVASTVVLAQTMTGVVEARTLRKDRGDLPAGEQAKPKPVREAAGPMLIAVSIADQRVTVYGANGAIAHAPVSTGQDGHRTPTGVFSVIQKSRYHESNIYSGAPMPYMQRITWSGIALHEGVLPGYPASHGCIRMPGGFASQLWGMTRLGVRVVVTPRDGGLAPLVSDRLPAPLLRLSSAASPGQVVQVATTSAAGEAAGPRRLSPQEWALEQRAIAIKAEAAAQRAAKEALELAATKSQMARDAVAAVRGAESDLAVASRRMLALARPGGTTNDAEVTVKSAYVQLAGLEQEDAEDKVAYLKSVEPDISDAAFAAARDARDAEDAATAAAAAVRDANRRLEPLTIFVSRQEGRIFLRQGFETIYESPVSIAAPDQPLGTHVLMAMAADNGGERLLWAATTVPTSQAAESKAAARGSKRQPQQQVPVSTSARTALDRIEFSAEARAAIADRLWVGATMIISDFGISHETGEGTDFVVLTR